ncbi:hypothetical protein NE237_031147 [Protea cynaroides]|uniref:Photolyase/cryptochrome alpha/beta domain-containing protein n=1 Tax=Protea cynaroides TaxID=273540 RepID=A0A9Q0R2B0_9MAGN|nr:hypothetical protein NE237_031147 [Protea cynaroides]
MIQLPVEGRTDCYQLHATEETSTIFPVTGVDSSSNGDCNYSLWRCRFFSTSASAQVDTKRKKDDDVALLWFKHDLHPDDHPGFSNEMLELVILALEDLREWLKSQGSNLMIRFGSAENVILELVQEVKANHVFSEEEVEYNFRRMIDIVEGSLSSVTFSWGCPHCTLADSFFLVSRYNSCPS